MYLNDLDPHFIKSIGHLYTSDNIPRGDPLPLQFFLEDAIKNKTGVTKDLSGVVAASMKHRRISEFKPFTAVDESNGSSSDKELELDLLKEDLMCIICKNMDFGARNRLLECSDCHALYHQECHKPIVTNQDSFDSWVCQNCKDASKKLKANTVATVVPTAPPGKVPSTSTKSNSSHRSSFKPDSKSEKYSKSSSGSSKTSPKPSTNSSSSRSNVTPNINIISADKRIQIMKKKAAKLQEKRLTRMTR